jgi:hypothetical protein
MTPFAKIIGAVLCGGTLLLAIGENAGAEDANPAILELVAIKASKDTGPFDKRLASYEPELRALPYRSFSLISARACTVRAGDRCGMRISGDAYLAVRAVENADRYLRVNVALNSRNRPVLDADLKINRDAGVMLTNVRREGPALIVSIKVKDRPHAAAGVTDN